MMARKNRRLTEHDKAVLPTNRKPHFLYRTESLGLNPAAIAKLGYDGKELASKQNMHPSQIEVFTRGSLEGRITPQGLAAYDELIDQMRTADPELDSAAVLACRFALPHDDNIFEGKAFLSTVLHTGPHPYLMSMFTTEPGERVKNDGSRRQLVIDTVRELKVGDTFMFDPTVPHMAAPMEPHADQWLILLQLERPLKDARAYATTLKRYARHSQDAEFRP
jgi:hypothetical protein